MFSFVIFLLFDRKETKAKTERQSEGEAKATQETGKTACQKEARQKKRCVPHLDVFIHNRLVTCCETSCFSH